MFGDAGAGAHAVLAHGELPLGLCYPGRWALRTVACWANKAAAARVFAHVSTGARSGGKLVDAYHPRAVPWRTERAGLS